jgi:hypothetical protein
MSLKPLKASTQKKREAAMQKKRKRIEELHKLPPYTIIFSEGIKTEPFYIQGLTRQVNQKYAQFTSADRITVIGTGRNTQSLLKYARETVDAKYPECEDVWLMYDQDDFPYDDFDNTQFSAEGRTCQQKYHVAWSNECIELWFLLHFQSLFAHVGREQYHVILKGYFPYEKTLENIYDLLKDKTLTAIAHAKALYASYEEGTPPSQRTPATRVHELVGFLHGYL